MIAMLVIMNIAISFTAYASNPDNNYSDWLSGDGGKDANRAINTANENQGVISSDGIQSQSNPIKVDDGQGFSLYQMLSTLWNLIVNVLFGGLATGISIARAGNTGANTITSAIGWLLLLFFSYLSISITLKTVAWFRNRDIR